MFRSAEGGMDRGERLLDSIYDDVEQQLGLTGDDCWHCGGEGYTYDCIDGCCDDAESGCPQCERRCPECARREHDFRKAVRKAVIASGDVDLAIAWLKSIGRWRDDITRERVAAELEAATVSATETSVSDTGLRDVLRDALNAATE